MITIVKEPVGEQYRTLLTFAASFCEHFSLVWRKQFTFAPSAHDVAHSLKPFIVSNDLTDKWPGTELLGHHALVRRYRVTEESIKQLFIVDTLFSWIQPTLPEDLVFYSSGTRPWLVTISHERDAWFDDSSLSLEEIRISVPGIIVSNRN